MILFVQLQPTFLFQIDLSEKPLLLLESNLFGMIYQKEEGSFLRFDNFCWGRLHLNCILLFYRVNFSSFTTICEFYRNPKELREVACGYWHREVAIYPYWLYTSEPSLKKQDISSWDQYFELQFRIKLNQLYKVFEFSLLALKNYSDLKATWFCIPIGSCLE